MLSKSEGSLINAGDPVSFKKISILFPSSCEAMSIKYLELKLMSNSLSNFTFNVSFPSPLLVLLTERFNLSLTKLNFTPSFLSIPFDTALNVCGKPVFSLAKTLDIPVNVGPTTFVDASPTALEAPFNDGPTKVKAPKNAVPSAPNFNLFLNTAAAYSFGS